MSKFLKIMIVMVTILAVAAPVVIAEDRLSLSGTMRVRGFSFSEYDFDDSVDTHKGFFDQRLRIAGKLSIAEGVSITFRTDITETVWGNNTNVRPAASQQWDRAHINLDKGMVGVNVGQIYTAMGTGIAFDNQGTGAKFKIKTGAPITVIYQRQDSFPGGTCEDGSSNGSGVCNDNADIYGLQVDHKTDNYSANVFFGYAHKDQGLLDSNIYLVGASGSFGAGPVAITAELDFFGGDYEDAAGTDAVGLQGYIDASMPINEAFTLGGMFLYAASADDNDNEEQITRLGNGFAGWSPETYGPFTTDFAEALDGYVFDPTGNDNGVIAFMPYANFKLNDATDLTGALMYLMPEDDGINGNDSVGGLESALIFNAGIDYQLMANTKLASQFNYTSKTVMQGSDPDGAYAIMGRVQVNF